MSELTYLVMTETTSSTEARQVASGFKELLTKARDYVEPFNSNLGYDDIVGDIFTGLEHVGDFERIIDYYDQLPEVIECDEFNENFLLADFIVSDDLLEMFKTAVEFVKQKSFNCLRFKKEMLVAHFKKCLENTYNTMFKQVEKILHSLQLLAHERNLNFN